MDLNAKGFPLNKIVTNKYNIFTFIPKNLATQFSKMSNIYFLIIGIMQTFKRISITNGVCTMAAPLGFVILVSMLKDAFEDY